MTGDSFEEGNASQLRQRLWGAAVLIAIAVIVLPLILDGAGSESQFRQVERLREEPSIVEPSAPRATLSTRSIKLDPEMRAVDSPATSDELLDRVVGSKMPEVAKNDAIVAENEIRQTLSSSATLPLTAWVVQAASFANEEDALQQRDELRRAGFASFVRDRNADTDPFLVLVGPMIKQASAEKARQRVAALLKNKPIILTYP